MERLLRHQTGTAIGRCNTIHEDSGFHMVSPSARSNVCTKVITVTEMQLNGSYLVGVLLRSTAHKVVHTDIFSCCSYVGSRTHFLLDITESERERLGQIKSNSTTYIRNRIVFHTP